MRGLAALSVATAHALGGGAALGLAWPGLARLPWLAGVDVFFVISGFVMVHAAGGGFGRPGARRHFLSHRIARVVPLYWAVTTAFVLLAVLRPGAFVEPFGGWAHLLASYALVPWPRLDGSMLPVFRLGWTLQYEALFYALFALWLGASRPAGLAGIAASLGCLVGLGASWPGAPATLRFWADPIVVEFAVGMGLAVAHRAGLRLPLLAAPVLLGGLLLLPLDIPSVWQRPLAYGLPAALLVGLVLLQERPVLGAGLRWLALRAGSLSYALYLGHLFAVRAVREAWPHLSLPRWSFLPAALAASLVLAAVLHRTVEQPLAAAARRWLA